MFSDGEQDPVLIDAIREQIKFDIQSINNVEGIGTMGRVYDYVLVGPLLKEQSAPNCAAIIMVQLNTNNLQDVLKERLENHVTNNLNNRLLTGTVHPVVYKLTENKIDMRGFSSVFHPYSNKWIKKPRFLGS